MSKVKEPSWQESKFDDLMDQYEEMVQELEHEGKDLDASMKLYQEAVALGRHLQERLVVFEKDLEKMEESGEAQRQ